MAFLLFGRYVKGNILVLLRGKGKWKIVDVYTVNAVIFCLLRILCYVITMTSSRLYRKYTFVHRSECSLNVFSSNRASQKRSFAYNWRTKCSRSRREKKPRDRAKKAATPVNFVGSAPIHPTLFRHRAAALEPQIGSTLNGNCCSDSSFLMCILCIHISNSGKKLLYAFPYIRSSLV